jgi:hypothetical protein
VYLSESVPFDSREQEFMVMRFLGEVRAIQRIGARRLQNASDKSFPHHHVVDANESGHDVYMINVLLVTR